MTTRVFIAGSTGSIGTQALDVIGRANAKAKASGDEPVYEVVAISAFRSTELIAQQAIENNIGLVGAAPSVLDELSQRLNQMALANEVGAAPSNHPFADGHNVRVLPNSALLSEAIDRADVVINAVVGFAGLDVTLETLRAGKRLALANKESLIAAGPVVRPLRSIEGAEIVPVDSEHCALHQCLRANESETETHAGNSRMAQLKRLVLTASGGPFRSYSEAQLEEISVQAALNHPTWSMGPKITIDSSTLMNKGLEVIEAAELFGVSMSEIDVVIHPQSVIHSMVEYSDGATIAQLSLPDMRLCIAYALDFPDRHPLSYGAIDWSELSRLDFEPPRTETFRCLKLAYRAGELGNTAPAELSAANEVMVQAFLDGAISWLDIARGNEAVLDLHESSPVHSVEDILEADKRARSIASEIAASFSV